MLYKLSVEICHHNLTALIKKFVDYYFDLFKKNGVEGSSHFMTYQFFYMFLNLRPEFVIIAYEKAQKKFHESSKENALLVPITVLVSN